MSKADDVLKLADYYYNRCLNEPLVKTARIRRLPNGKYRVLSRDGKNLGTYNSSKGAKKRLKQVEFFKHFDHSNADDTSVLIDLSKVEEFTYSAMMRQLRQNASKEQVMCFLKLFKLNFDKAVKQKMQKPEKIALQNALVKFNKLHKVKIDKKIVKNAATTELGDPAQVGQYLANIVRFTLMRISPEKRQKAIESIRNKLYYLNESEIAMKKMPASSAMGQCITFVKHVLFNQDAQYIREVLNNLVRNL